MMYVFCYILGMIALTALSYGTILTIRKNKQEALTTAAGVFIAIAVLGLIKWILF